jgi:hypothetical protein
MQSPNCRVRSVATGFHVHDVYRILAKERDGVYTLTRGGRETMRFTVRKGAITRVALL